MSVCLEEPVRTRKDCVQVSSHSALPLLAGCVCFHQPLQMTKLTEQVKEPTLSLGMDHLDKNGFSSCFDKGRNMNTRSQGSEPEAIKFSSLHCLQGPPELQRAPLQEAKRPNQI